MTDRRARVLVVDDDADLRRLLELRLRAGRYEVELAASAEDALGIVGRRPPDVVITDVRMDGMDGMQLFAALQARHSGLPVILLTAHGTIPDAVEATRQGAFAYLTKPFDGAAVLALVADAVRLGGVEGASGDDDGWRAALLTRSARMEELLARARRVGAAEVSVLIRGESGTGKELLARALHEASPRASGPFVAVNCAAIPEHLIESELFGHRRGAFTGADRDHPGLMLAADRGTLFLDEVGDMPLPFQAKLLRVLQEGEVRAVGATSGVPVDVRVVSATHRDLAAAVAEQRFREDLLYRLDVVTLELPSLAQRREDVPLLAGRFLEDAAARVRREVRFAPEAMELLVSAPWPGNVRQLRNVVEQCVALAAGPVVPARLVAEALRAPVTGLPTLDEVRAEAERDYLRQLLELTEGNVSRAARIAGRNRTEFYKLLGKHALEPERFR